MKRLKKFLPEIPRDRTHPVSAKCVISSFEARAMLEQKDSLGKKIEISLDLGMSESEVEITKEGVRISKDAILPWERLEKISNSGRKVFYLIGNEWHEAKKFSERSGLMRSLVATGKAPTMMVSGILMHRIKEIDPITDTQMKLQTIAPIRGHVLDTATGLGYTAIEAAKTAEYVLTIELDPVSLELAAINPWSRNLFTNPRIERILGDTSELIYELPAGSFSAIIHDPPTMSLAGEMYSGAFYEQLFRVLSRKGKLFHYVGDPESRTSSRVVKGVMRRLNDVGFRKVRLHHEAFGISAEKT